MRALLTLRVLTSFIVMAASATARAADAGRAAGPLDALGAVVLRSGCLEGVPALAAAVEQPGLSDEDRAFGRRLVAMCAAIARERIVAGPAPRLEAEPDRSGRAKLIFAATAYGIWTGVAIDLLTEIEGRALVLPPLLGGAAGLGLSFYATRAGPISSGQAWAIITGLDYGTYSGLLWGAAIDDDQDVVIGTALATGLVGGAVATPLAMALSPRQGQVELVRSGGLWGFATGALVAALVQPDGTRATFAAMGAGIDGGLIAGVALGQVFQPTRNRMLLIDTAALSGGLLGFAAAFLALGSPDGNTEERILAGSALGGLYLGLATGVYLTRGMKPDREDAASPVPAMIVRERDGRLRLGRLAVLPVITADAGGARLTGALAPILGGAL